MPQLNDRPLAGIRVVEMAGLGPCPFAGMFLAELGADVVKIDRPGGNGWFTGQEHLDLFNRGKRSVLVDLKHSDGNEVVLQLAEKADVFLEGYRPGVAERLGFGPEACMERNPGLVYGRMTGWGQDGPLSLTAGHDIDYISLTGALDAIGNAGGPPTIPLNLVGDFGGGGNYLVIGVLSALLERQRSGLGQVIDAAIVDGAAHLLSGIHTMLAVGGWTGGRGENLLDGGAPFYTVYETLDGGYLAVGAIEPKFYAEFVSRLGVNLDVAEQNDRRSWPSTRRLIAERFAERTLSEWTDAFEGTDACVSPVVGLGGAATHPHVAARGSVVERRGVLQAGPAPRFSRTPTAIGDCVEAAGAHSREVLGEWGLDGVDSLLDAGVVFQAELSGR